jgi:hypothetical protein
VLETRLGLGRLERADHDGHYTSPLLDLTLGVARHLEVSSALEYDLDDDRLGDGEIGLKWARPWDSVSLGIEGLALLPVSSRQSGVGAEAQLLATFRHGAFSVHANAGGFYDPRFDDIERGWTAGVLAEWERGPARVGLELSAQQVSGEGAELLAGPGVIWSLGPLDVRAGLHAGLTEEAPDLVLELWLSTEWRLW